MFAIKERQIKLLQWNKQVVNFVKKKFRTTTTGKDFAATESYFSPLFKSYFHSALTRDYCLHPETVLIIIQSPPRSCLKMFLSENCSHHHPTPFFSLNCLLSVAGSSRHCLRCIGSIAYWPPLVHQTSHSITSHINLERKRWSWADRAKERMVSPWQILWRIKQPIKIWRELWILSLARNSQ